MSRETDIADNKTISGRLIYPVLDQFFHFYLTERNIEKTLSLVADNIYSLGTGEGEVAVNKEEFALLLKQEIANLPSPIKYQISNYTEKQVSSNCWQIYCKMETCIEQEDLQPVYYCTRLTGTFCNTDGKYLATSLHMSEGSRTQDNDEFFPLRFISEQARKLSGQTQRKLLDILCVMMPSGIIGSYMEEGFPLYVVNDTLLNMTGYTYDEFVKTTGGLVINSIHEEDAKRVSERIFQSTGDGYSIKYRIRKKDGNYIWVYDIGRKITVEDDRAVVISVLVDISNEIQNRYRLMEESYKDFLTGIYNRRGGMTLIADKMKNPMPYTFFMMDIDNFKRVNDLYGHDTGDYMLQYVANTLKETFRQTDVVIRMGGDEFAVLAYPCMDMQAIQLKAEAVTQKYLREAMIKCPGIRTSISIGGIHSDNPRTFAELYKMADDVLYEVKQSKKGRCIILEAK